MVRDIPRALSAAERALAMDSRSSDALRYLQWTYEAAKQYQKAIETAARRPDVDRDAIAMLREGFQAAGEVGYWQAWHKSRLKEPTDESSCAWEMAGFHARLGQQEQVLGWLKKALDLHYTNAVYLNVASEFERIRSVPEFQRLVRRIGLPVR